MPFFLLASSEAHVASATRHVTIHAFHSHQTFLKHVMTAHENLVRYETGQVNADFHVKLSRQKCYSCNIFEFSSHPTAFSTPVVILMALVPVEPDLQTLFLPILATQRELTRANEILYQVDDLSDYTEDVDLPAATNHLHLVRQQLQRVFSILRLRLAIQMAQLARYFRQHFRRQYRIPIVNLDFR